MDTLDVYENIALTWLNSTKHPSAREGELFIGNYRDSEDFIACKWKTKRRGSTLDKRPEESECGMDNYFPVFVSKEEAIKKGFVL